MYHTRLVYPIPLDRAGDVAAHVATVVQQCGDPPSNVSLNVPETGESDAIVTITYVTTTPAESDRIISVWRNMNPTIQVERTHRLNPDQLEAVAMANPHARRLKHHLIHQIRAMCARGVGSAGVLNYLDECKSAVEDMQEFVQSMRAPL